jgi:hypothetical protein
VLRHGGIFARSPDALQGPKGGPSSLAVLAAAPKCRFREGFAAEGMLCNNPPIPLRVLDFLETEDLLNLALVCKATHQAGHVLLQREVRKVMSSLCTMESTPAILLHQIQNGWQNDFALNLLGTT